MKSIIGDAAYRSGYVVGGLLFPLILYAIIYFAFKVIKKRKPYPKEQGIIIAVVILLFILSLAGRASNA